MSDNQRPSLEIIEPFRRGAMVHFAHKLGNGLSTVMDPVRVIGSAGFELASLDRSYEFIEGFDIPRQDLVGGNASHGLVAKLGRGLQRLRVMQQFLTQYGKVVNQTITRQPDYVMVATVFRYPMMSRFLAKMRRRGVKCLQICHEFQMREEKKRLSSRLLFLSNRNVYENFHAIFFLSDSQRQAFHTANPQIESKRLFVIPCGNGDIFGEIRSQESRETIASRYGVDPSKPLVLFFGRIRHDKGVEDLIEGFKLLCQRHDRPAQLLLAGHATPALTQKLQSQIENAGIADRVTIYPDYVDAEDVWPLHELANATIFPYRSSSQSAAVQTAMACERPIVVSNVGGLAETIRHEREGLVVPARDPMAISEAIQRYLEDPEFGQRMGQAAGHESRTTYAWETIAEQIASACQSLNHDETD
ncbi:MAG: glycosyltransferase family 4 protein [Rubripirellula sp.]